jgi:tripartite-type tricarboxylate transporter receptor subunit TctC
MSVNTSRRSLVLSTLCVAGGMAAGVSPAAMTAAAAEERYPDKPIRWIVPLPPGGGGDIVARLVAERLTQRLGQQVIVENKGGGGGIIGAEFVAHAPPDGYTILLCNATTHAINASLVKNLGYDPVKDYTPVELIASLPLILVVDARIPVNTLPELIAYARQRPGQLSFGSTSNGSSIHLAGEMLNMAAGIKVIHVPYRGAAPALTDLLGGRFAYMFTTIPPVLQYVRNGQLRALAVASNERSPLLPDLPTTAEAGAPGVVATSWLGVVGPAGMPQAAVSRLNRELAAIMAMPDLQKRLAEMGVEPKHDTPAQFATFMKEETARYAKAVQASGAHID